MTEEKLQILNAAHEKMQKATNMVAMAEGGMEQCRKSEYPSRVAEAMQNGLTREQRLHVANLCLAFTEYNERRVRAWWTKMQ